MTRLLVFAILLDKSWWWSAVFAIVFPVANFDFFFTFSYFFGDGIGNGNLQRICNGKFKNAPNPVANFAISRCKFWHFFIFLYHVDFSQNAETSVAAEPDASNPVANSLKSRCKFPNICEGGVAVMSLGYIRRMYEITAPERNGCT